MLQHLTRYFAAEKQESLLFVLVGLVAIGVAAWLWTGGHRLRSMAFPLVAVALIQIAVGASVTLRTDAQVKQIGAQLTAAPAQFKTEETQRMDKVMKNFTLYKLVEIGLLALGAALIAFALRNDVAAGIGAGLVIQSSFMLCLDVFAEARGLTYLVALRALPGV